MINRREFVGLTLSAGAGLALAPRLGAARGGPELVEGPELLFAQAPGTLLHRAIPSSGEMLPAVSFSPREEADSAAMKEILKTFLSNGGKVVDVMHGGPAGEEAGRTAAKELGMQDKFFWTASVVGPASIPMLPGGGPPPPPPAAAVRAAVDAKLAQLKVPMIDLVMGAPALLPVMREMKKEGRIRYIGLWGFLPTPQLVANVRSHEIDIVAAEYSVGSRQAEQTLLPLALERKIAFMSYFTFDRGRLFQRASGTPLPEWAAEFGAKTWAQFFVKYVLSHPAVTVARTGTTKAAHMLENLGAGTGRLPDEAMRKRMAAFIDTLPRTPQAPAPPAMPQQMKELQTSAVVLSAATLDRYVGEYIYTAAGTIVTVRRDGDRLLLKSGTLAEGPLAALSETRFGTAAIQIAPSLPWLATIEFQLDGQGKVTGAIIKMGPNGEGNQFPLVRR